ncbi:hypothetical protein JG688_00008694 [Phytophthora aleatoria]|uniref:Uncharacterized protein n=1 Tax=Phytophthora aleatoria TaxID=2496075 RepID=A0A8J5M772_9STRA|nr:hypothetical protein JG688_00008694 [Phytophthora aleatoria]
MVCWNAMKQILKELNGERQEKISMLLNYLTLFKKIYLWASLAWEATGGTFSRVFVASSQSTSALTFLRPRIALDGTNMKSVYK